MAARDPQDPKDPPADDRLGSWKAIAGYLQRDITTVQRWERVEGMPVHRHVHAKRGSVYAFRSELDAWRKNRRQQLDNEPPPPADTEPAPAKTITPRLVGIAVAAVIAVLLAWWLSRPEPEPPNPLASMHITALTDFDGLEQAAAISPDGKFAAFLSDRDGTLDT